MALTPRDSLFARYELFVAAGTLAAHATAHGEGARRSPGFRQRDARFFAELFSNWMSITLTAPIVPVQNTQMLRYLTGLVADGLARKTGRSAPPRYALTRGGVLELLRRVTDTNRLPHPGFYFFIRYFITAYGDTLAGLATPPFPPALREELTGLLDVAALNARHRAHVRRRIAAIQERITSNRAGAETARKSLAKGHSLTDTAQTVEASFPYELNSQRPLPELMSTLHPERATWELTTGAELRTAYLWEPMLKLSKLYEQLVED